MRLEEKLDEQTRWLRVELWVEAVEDRCEGITCISPGCAGGQGGVCEDCHCEGGEDHEYCNEGSFSSWPCETCGCHLGGDRYAGHGFVADENEPGPGAVVHLSMCGDCCMYFANGETPDPEYLGWLD